MTTLAVDMVANDTSVTEIHGEFYTRSTQHM